MLHEIYFQEDIPDLFHVKWCIKGWSLLFRYHSRVQNPSTASQHAVRYHPSNFFIISLANSVHTDNSSLHPQCIVASASVIQN